MGARPQRGADSRRSAAGRTCERCGAPVITQWTRGTASLKVTADAEPQPVEQLAPLAEPNRLLWCLTALHGGGVELRWRCRRQCTHGVVIEHRCPEGTPLTPKPEGALW